jgi:hypothetical protein
MKHLLHQAHPESDTATGWAAVLAPLQGAARAGRNIPEHRVAQPWARLSRPVGPISRSPKGTPHAAAEVSRPVRPVPGAPNGNPEPHALRPMPVGSASRAPNGGQEHSPGMSTAIPRETNPRNVPRPEGAQKSPTHRRPRHNHRPNTIPTNRHSNSATGRAASLAPLQGAACGGRSIPEPRVAQPWARLSRPLGPMSRFPDGNPQAQAEVSRPVRPVPAAPNGGQEHSPGMSTAIPRVTNPHPVPRPEGAQESPTHRRPRHNHRPSTTPTNRHSNSATGLRRMLGRGRGVEE